MDKQKKIVVVGGGIAGLATAYYIQKEARQRGLTISLRVIEREPRWGGNIRTDYVDNFVIEAGPDTFLATKPWAVALCRELGIEHRLRGTNPQHKKTYILHREDLHQIPGGLTMMIPTDIRSMLLTDLLTWTGKARMGLDLFIPVRKNVGDESMGEFVTRRLGREAYEHLVEPLMSGIYAGDGDKLSIQSTLPYLRDVEQKYGGLVRGALAVRKANSKNGKSTQGSQSMFLTPVEGLAEIVKALTEVLHAGGTDLRAGVEVKHLSRVSGHYRLMLSDNTILDADGLVLATPAYVSGALLGELDPEIAAELKAVEYISTATVSLAYRNIDLPQPLDGYGYVIPRREGRKALACTWTSTKFLHRAPEGYALLRVFVGRAGQEADISWKEDDLLSVARDELKETIGITVPPLISRVFIWDRAMPQYNVGHSARLQRLDQMLQRWPGLSLAGNGYRGIGIPDCIRSGQVAAEDQIARVMDKPGKIAN